MLIGALMVAAHHFQPFGKTFLGDAVGNLAGGRFGVGDIDRLPVQHPAEHQCQRRGTRGGRAARRPPRSSGARGAAPAGAAPRAPLPMSSVSSIEWGSTSSVSSARAVTGL